MEFGVVELPARGLGPVLEDYEDEERERAEEAERERLAAEQAQQLQQQQQSQGLAPIRSRVAEFISSRVHLPVLTEVATRTSAVGVAS